MSRDVHKVARPWTCTAVGDSCTLPFEFNGLHFSACTQQLSDPHDADQDGSLHNGHPQCQSAAGLSLAVVVQVRSRPATCPASAPHTQLVALVTCAPSQAISVQTRC